MKTNQISIAIFKLTLMGALLTSCSSSSDKDTITEISNPKIIPTGQAQGTAGHNISGSTEGKITKSSSGEIYYNTEIDGDEIEITQNKNGDQSIKINGNEEKSLFVGSFEIPFIGDTFDNSVGVMHVSFIGKGGKPISAYDSINTGFETGTIDFDDNKNFGEMIWNEVEYSYSIASTNPYFDEPTSIVKGKDGSIEFVDDKWTATFGDVKLTGSVTGNFTIAGSAELDFSEDGGPKLTGDFSGVDGIMNVPDGAFVTMGGYAGEDGGTTTSFSGNWYGLNII